MNSDRFVTRWHIGFFPNIIDPLRNTFVVLFTGNRSKTALRACSSLGLEKVLSLCFVFLMSSDDPGPWDPRDPVAVEPLFCPKIFQDLVESGPLEREATVCSKEVTSHKTPQQFVQYL